MDSASRKPAPVAAGSRIGSPVGSTVTIRALGRRCGRPDAVVPTGHGLGSTTGPDTGAGAGSNAGRTRPMDTSRVTGFARVGLSTAVIATNQLRAGPSGTGPRSTRGVVSATTSAAGTCTLAVIPPWAVLS